MALILFQFQFRVVVCSYVTSDFPFESVVKERHTDNANALGVFYVHADSE